MSLPLLPKGQLMVKFKKGLHVPFETLQPYADIYEQALWMQPSSEKSGVTGPRGQLQFKPQIL